MSWIFLALGVIGLILSLIALQLLGIKNSIDAIGQLVAIGMQRSGLVRTHEELANDTEVANEEEPEEEWLSQEVREAIKDQEDDITM